MLIPFRGQRGRSRSPPLAARHALLKGLHSGQPMDVSVIGASGDCGREIVSQLVAAGGAQSHGAVAIGGAHRGAQQPDSLRSL